ncbi:MAG: hydantoinase B/oxoprolinase family protein [Planctomycetota bacterium]|nr:hydantoinase B/oxoprolinase family protein [Planctomycetota bacterium]
MVHQWFIAVDVGGTFCDAIAVAPDGQILRAKIPSAAESRHDGGLAAPLAIAHQLTNTPLGTPLPLIHLRVGTTRGTNALLEGRVSAVCAVLPEGLVDILELQDQRRPDLFAWHPTRKRPPTAARVTTNARIASNGMVLQPLTKTECDRVVDAVVASKTDAVAIALLHADVDPSHEQQLASAIRSSVAHAFVTTSHAMGRVSGFVDRARAAHVNALLSGSIQSFMDEISQGLTEGSSLFMMSSAGGLSHSTLFQPKDSLLSGPAGGVRGALAVSLRLGLGPTLAFDMGGTSTDISRFDNDIPISFKTTVGDVTIESPSTTIDTIAAGGGSIVSCIGGEIRIGPASAGSHPGPACYGRGGPLTLTDLNLLAHRLGELPIPIFPDAASARFNDLHAQFEQARGPIQKRLFIESLIALADEMMAAAIRRTAVRLGHDPSDHTLLAFGGAGPLHACSVAEKLGIDRVLVPVDAGLLSAWGIASAHRESVAQRSMRILLCESKSIHALLQELDGEALASFHDQPLDASVVRRIVTLRLQGQESSLSIEWGETTPVEIIGWLRSRFEEEYRRVYSSEVGARAIEIEAVLVVARSIHSRPTARDEVATAFSQSGPCVIPRMDCTMFVADGWRAKTLEDGSMEMMREQSVNSPTASPMLEEEIFSARVRAVADEMGEQLRRTAVSVNVKDRLDFSCSVLDSDGWLVANAPHLPVHLGAMGACVRSTVARLNPSPGEAIVVNHPAYGGSHLPDITVITPVFARGTSQRIAFVANRAHHAELGGMLPGSMAPFAQSLSEEGIVFPPTLIMRGGVTDFGAFSSCLRNAPFPSRQPLENELDLAAQVSCNEVGSLQIQRLAEALTVEGLRDRLQLLRDTARRRAQVAVESLPADELIAHERLDDGSPLAVRIRRRGGLGHRTLTMDFTGSASIHSGNFNAPEAVVRSVVMYVLRLIAGRERPSEASGMVLNEGFLADVTLTGMGGMVGTMPADMNAWPAVGAGNTETSQRLTDLLLKACQVAACSQGTMNNLLFGSAQFSCYETIAGGAGATSAGSGLSGIHTHMTNTRVTDPEILERRLPVRLERFELRAGSGGDGLHRGGDGVIRTIRFLEPVSVTLLSQHRVEAPYGMNGGMEGLRGAQFILRANGSAEIVDGVMTAELSAGDAIEIQTPGGGGWGDPTRHSL